MAKDPNPPRIVGTTPQQRAHEMVELLRQGDDSFQTTRAESVLNWARKYSMFLYPFVTACCGMEFMSTVGPRYDMDRFGCALPRFSPRQSDLLMVVGTISHRQAPILKKVYDQMAEPKWVMAFGACTCSGGPYDNYATVQGIDTIVPVDIYIPGCPPRPEAVLDGLIKLQARVQAERVPADGRHVEIADLPPVKRARAATDERDAVARPVPAEPPLTGSPSTGPPSSESPSTESPWREAR